MQFYKPHPWFLDRLVELANGRLVIECGCGEGHLLKALLERGVDAYGIDLYACSELATQPPVVGRLLEADALSCELLLKASNALIIVARPNHSGWFAELLKVVDPSCDVLYIGLKQNVELDGADALVPLDARPVAEGDATIERRFNNKFSDDMDPNHVVFVRPSSKVIGSSENCDMLYLFSLVKRVELNMDTCFWGEPKIRHGGLVFMNEAGGYDPKFDTDCIIRTVIARDERLLDRRETSEYQDFMKASADKNLVCGWIDRSGHFYRCRYMDHVRILYVLFGMSEAEAERKGWVKVHSDDNFSGAFWSFDSQNRGIRLTLEQIRTLREDAGFTDVDEDASDGSGSWLAMDE